MSAPGDDLESIVIFDTDPDISPVEKIERSLVFMSNLPGKAHDKAVMANIKCISGDKDGTLEFDLLVTEGLCNLRRVLHGSATTLIFDVCSSSSLVILAKPGFWAVQSQTNPKQAKFLGLSRNLNTTYVRTAPVGSVVRITTTPVHVGSRNALVRCVIHDKASGKLLSHGTQDMVNLGSVSRGKL